MARELTEKQEAFLQFLFNEAGGDVKLAAEMAGYNPYAWNKVVASLREEILERAEYNLALKAAKAVNTIGDAMEKDESTTPGVNTRISAAKEVLDRVGLAKKDRLQIEGTGGNAIFILPAKNPVPDDNKETDPS
jgi:hypothetical protein